MLLVLNRGALSNNLDRSYQFRDSRFFLALHFLGLVTRKNEGETFLRLLFLALAKEIPLYAATVLHPRSFKLYLCV